MSRKTVLIKPQARKAQTDAMNIWVAQGAENAARQHQVAPAEKEPMKRLSIDLPASLHKELMMYCAANGTKAASLVREALLNILHK